MAPLLLFLLLLRAAVVCQSTTSPPWGQLGADAAHTAQSAFPGPLYGNVQDTFTLTGGGGVWLPVVDAAGTVYVIEKDNAVIGYTPASSASWVFWDGFLPQGPLLTDGVRVFAVNQAGVLTAVDAAAGTWLWARSGVNGGPVLSPSGVLYAQCNGSYVSAITAATGAVQWTLSSALLSAAEPLSGPPALLAATDSLYLTSSGQLWVLRASTGASLWSAAVGSMQGAAPVASASLSLVLCLLVNGTLVGVNASSGVSVWRTDTGTYPMGTLSPAVSASGTVYLVGGDATVRAYSGATGVLLWSFDDAFTSDAVWPSSPAIASDGTVFATPDNTAVYALNGSSGGLVWSTPLIALFSPQMIASSPVLGANRDIYVGNTYFDNNPCLLRVRDGAPPSATRTHSLTSSVSATMSLTPSISLTPSRTATPSLSSSSTRTCSRSPSPSSSLSSSPSPSYSPSPSSSRTPGLVVVVGGLTDAATARYVYGGMGGGLALLVAVCVGWRWWRRRHREHAPVVSPSHHIDVLASPTPVCDLEVDIPPPPEYAQDSCTVTTL